MFGMVCVLFSVAVWLILATMKGLPVSTTHSCIGGIIGMTVVCKGFKAVNWKGIGMVFSSWIIAPVVSGLLSTFLFVVVRKTILRAANSLQRAFKSYSPIVGFTIGFNIFLILYNSESLGINLPIYTTALTASVSPSPWHLSFDSPHCRTSAATSKPKAESPKAEWDSSRRWTT